MFFVAYLLYIIEMTVKERVIALRQALSCQSRKHRSHQKLSGRKASLQTTLSHFPLSPVLPLLFGVSVHLRDKTGKWKLISAGEGEIMVQNKGDGAPEAGWKRVSPVEQQT